jgi:hypothetical protein
MVSDWNCLKHFCCFFCTVVIRCTETFGSPCIFRNCDSRTQRTQITFFSGVPGYAYADFWRNRNTEEVINLKQKNNELHKLFFVMPKNNATSSEGNVSCCLTWGGNAVWYARTNAIGSRTSFVIASVRSSIHWNIQWNLGSRTPLITKKIGSQTNYPNKKRLGWRTMSRVTNTQAGNNGWWQAGSIGGRASVAV